jgi:hypothetical protein
MPVQKFRTFEEARRALWAPSGDPRLLARMRRLGELGPRPSSRPGVFRFRTIEDAKRAKHAAGEAVQHTYLPRGTPV